MQRRIFSRAYKLEAVKLAKERGVAVTRAARDLDGQENVLRKCAGNMALIQPSFSGQRADKAGAA